MDTSNLKVGEFVVHRKLGDGIIKSVTQSGIQFEDKHGQLFNISHESANKSIALMSHEYVNQDKNYANLDDIKTSIKCNDCLWEPRQYQAHAYEALNADYASYSKLILALPTGAGKTYVAAKWIVDNYILRGKKVIWVAHRIELLQQAYKTFVNIAGESFSKSISWWAGEHPKSPHGQLLLVSIMATRDFPKLRADILVIDEAHHEPANTYRRLIAKIECEKHLGLTATPARLDMKPLGYEKISYQISFLKLVDGGWLARPVPFLPKTNLTYELELESDDFSEASLRQLDNSERNIFIVNYLIKNRAQLKTMLIFAVNREHAINLANLFKSTNNGIRVEYIISNDQSSLHRAEIINKFKSGSIDILINCMIFTEGFDCPDVNTVVLTRPTTSVTTYMQMVGRGSRITPRKHNFNIVDFEDNLVKFQANLVKPWCLGFEFDDKHSNQYAALETGLPGIISKDAKASNLSVQEIYGYVIYDLETGRQDGFILHQDDKLQFDSAISMLGNLKSRQDFFYYVEHFTRILLELNSTRLGYQTFLNFSFAFVKGNYKIFYLQDESMIKNIRDFLDDSCCAEETNSIINMRHDLYAVIKFKNDEIGNAYEIRLVFSTERLQFVAALNELNDIILLRGNELYARISDIYSTTVMHTSITSHEWSRFCINYIINSEGSLLVLEPLKSTIMPKVIDAPRADEATHFAPESKHFASPPREQLISVEKLANYDLRNLKPSRVRFGDDEYEASSWADVDVLAVKWFVKEGLLGEKHLPISASKNKYYISATPEHPLGGDAIWKNPEPGYYVDVKYNTSCHIKNLSKLKESIGSAVNIRISIHR